MLLEDSLHASNSCTSAQTQRCGRFSKCCVKRCIFASTSWVPTPPWQSCTSEPCSLPSTSLLLRLLSSFSFPKCFSETRLRKEEVLSWYKAHGAFTAVCMAAEGRDTGKMGASLWLKIFGSRWKVFCILFEFSLWLQSYFAAVSGRGARWLTDHKHSIRGDSGTGKINSEETAEGICGLVSQVTIFLIKSCNISSPVIRPLSNT